MSEERENQKRKKGRANLEEEMSFFGHLATLRMHLVRSALVIVSITALAFAYYDVIFNNIVMGPKNPHSGPTK